MRHERKKESFGNYNVQHNIIKNRKFDLIGNINSIFEYGLTKDTVLVGDLRYAIMIYPYRGL
ncbi:MAG: hypothetical protein Kow0027_22930 [Saprospiraceae bacterium]